MTWRPGRSYTSVRRQSAAAFHLLSAVMLFIGSGSVNLHTVSPEQALQTISAGPLLAHRPPLYKVTPEPGEMVQRLRELVALSEDQRSVSSTYKRRLTRPVSIALGSEHALMV